MKPWPFRRSSVKKNRNRGLASRLCLRRRLEGSGRIHQMGLARDLMIKRSQSQSFRWSHSNSIYINMIMLKFKRSRTAYLRLCVGGILLFVPAVGSSQSVNAGIIVRSPW